MADWEVEMVSAVIEAIKQGKKGQEVKLVSLSNFTRNCFFHFMDVISQCSRLTACLAFLLRASRLSMTSVGTSLEIFNPIAFEIEVRERGSRGIPVCRRKKSRSL